MSAEGVRLSLNEVETTARKALLGGGSDPGTAADVAAAVRWLCEHGHDGVGIVVLAMRNGDDFAGLVSAVDSAITAMGRSIPVERSPMLVAGLCGSAAHLFDLRFEVAGTDWSTAIGAREMVGTIGDGPALVRAKEAAASALPRDGGVSSVDPRAWAALEELATRIYVPSSDESRAKGAGAGLSDND